MRGPKSIVHDLAAYMRAKGTRQSIISDFVNDQAGSSWSSLALAVKRFLAGQREVDLSNYFWHTKSLSEANDRMQEWFQQHGEKPAKMAVQIYHAFHYEFFGKVDMRYNDRKMRMVRLVRTENQGVLARNSVQIGKGQKLKRGAHESSSIFKRTNAVAGGAVTVQSVPHHRITFSYFLDGSPGKNATGFMNDRENEVMFLTDGIQFEYLGLNIDPQD